MYIEGSIELVERLSEDVFKHIKKSKTKFIRIDDVSELIKEKLGEEYTSELGIAVKGALKDDERLDFFREDYYVQKSKYHYCTGNWLAIKGVYESPLEAKLQAGWLAWQLSEDDDGAWLD